MTPSRIVKSAHARARAAGFQGSLKQWAEMQIDNHTEHAHACVAWLTNKAKQRKPSRARKAAHGHNDVHEMATVRSARTSSGSNITLRGEVREQQHARVGTDGGR